MSAKQFGASLGETPPRGSAMQRRRATDMLMRKFMTIKLEVDVQSAFERGYIEGHAKAGRTTLVSNDGCPDFVLASPMDMQSLPTCMKMTFQDRVELTRVKKFVRHDRHDMTLN